jgi:hypothetical protein
MFRFILIVSDMNGRDASLLQMFRVIFASSKRRLTSTEANGSSKRITFGSCIKALPKATLCASPPDNPATPLRWNSGKPTEANTSSDPFIEQPFSKVF